MSQRVDNLKELIRYSTDAVLHIPNNVFTGNDPYGHFKKTRYALTELKKDDDITVTETIVKDYCTEFECNVTRVIRLTRKQKG